MNHKLIDTKDSLTLIREKDMPGSILWQYGTDLSWFVLDLGEIEGRETSGRGISHK